MGNLRGFFCVLGIVVLLSMEEMVLKVNADAMVTGAVFCDQCKDGERSFFDYPLYGARVAVACMGANGQVATYKEEGTNWMGSYAMRFEGSPDLTRCYAWVISGPSVCGAAAGPPRSLHLMLSMFGMQMYTVDSLLSQPQQPMAFCPNYSPPSPIPRVVPPPQWSPRTAVQPSHPPPSPPAVSRAPSIPFLDASACSYDKWVMPEYKCHWKVVGPDTKVSVAFGPIAARKYGTDMNLLEALYGRGDTYRTLLREATSALLNSYNSIQFSYPTLMVIDRMNWALLGSPQQALLIALRFKRANDGIYGNVACKFSPCS